ncbi:Nucleoporin [Operophtera brumata]|uniref:Nucleoporin n=1 Tax=Operophtera brumata TaxID=104452 RepID=A0A0L7LC94_OPEBR|nr:Nucleoporin [Operophtera brumata]
MLSALCSSHSSARHQVRVAPAPPAGLALSPAPLPTLLRQKVSFTSILQEILTREASQPILSISRRDEPPPKECLELVTGATLRLRGEYMSRQQRATTALRDKLRALAALVDTHRECVQQLQRATTALRDKLRALAALVDTHRECVQQLQVFSRDPRVGRERRVASGAPAAVGARGDAAPHRHARSAPARHQAARRQEGRGGTFCTCSAVKVAWGASGASPAERQLLSELVETRRHPAARRQAGRGGTICRCSAVTGASGASPAERQLLSELLKKWQEDYKRKDVALGKSHSDTIASVLQQHPLWHEKRAPIPEASHYPPD